MPESCAIMFLTRDQVREVDRRAIEEFGVPGVVLMENAGRGTAELLLRLDARGPVIICCGKGNNGGDGFVIARHLDNARVPVKVLLFADPAGLTGDAAINFRILDKAGFAITVITTEEATAKRVRQELAGAAWVVDALFGTGLNGPIKAPFDQIITAINECGVPVLAVDIPSGLDCDTGLSPGVAIHAQHTATFVAQKVGFANSAAHAYLGQVHVLPIGAPHEYLLAAPVAK
jgi:NAD(P)H-hydrate epimerase